MKTMRLLRPKNILRDGLFFYESKCSGWRNIVPNMKSGLIDCKERDASNLIEIYRVES